MASTRWPPVQHSNPADSHVETIDPHEYTRIIVDMIGMYKTVAVVCVQPKCLCTQTTHISSRGNVTN
jgi:hypothetical protein